MKKFGFIKQLFYGTLFSCLILSCSSDSGGEGPVPDDDGVPLTFDRGEMLENWADNIIIPAYAAFGQELGLLRTNFEDFRSVPSETNLLKLREAWLQAYLGWQRVSLFEVGPAESLGLRLQVNTFPTDTALLENYVSSGNYDLSLPANRDVKGFPAMDYLINGLESTDTQIVERYSTDTNKDGYLQYMDDILTDLEDLTGNIRDEWNQGYRDNFVSNDGSSATASVDRFVNDFIFYYEKFLRAGKMGIPLGVFTGSPAPHTLEAFYSPATAKVLFLEGINAVQDFFNGKHFGSNVNGESLAGYLRDLNTLKNGEELDLLINAQLDLAREKVSALNDFRDEIENNNPPTNMLLAYDEVQRAVPLFKVDMVSAMSISIDFVDADGD